MQQPGWDTAFFVSEKWKGYIVSLDSEIKRELHCLSCLSGWGDEELLSVGTEARLKLIPKNTILFNESVLMEFFFIMRTGTIKLFKTSSDGRELIVDTVGPGEHFCCVPLYVDGKYPVSAMALEDASLIAIPAEFFKKMLTSRVSELGLKIIADLCSRVKYLSNLVEDITFKDVEQRVIIALMRLSEKRSSEGNRVFLPFTHQEIASRTGTVREVVSRVILRLKTEEVITESSYGGFQIDKDKLLKLFNNKYPSLGT